MELLASGDYSWKTIEKTQGKPMLAYSRPLHAEIERPRMVNRKRSAQSVRTVPCRLSSRLTDKCVSYDFSRDVFHEIAIIWETSWSSITRGAF
jgi:hypothetical protein